jgi:hypothetical protein
MRLYLDAANGRRREWDAIEAVAAKYAADWPAWGHRKIAAMMRADGHQALDERTQSAAYLAVEHCD